MPRNTTLDLPSDAMDVSQDEILDGSMNLGGQNFPLTPVGNEMHRMVSLNNRFEQALQENSIVDPSPEELHEIDIDNVSQNNNMNMVANVSPVCEYEQPVEYLEQDRVTEIV